MPLILTNPTQDAPTLDAVVSATGLGTYDRAAEITFHGFNDRDGSGVIVYDLGYLDANGAFVPVIEGRQLALAAIDVQQLLAAANATLDGQANADLYAAEKAALYDLLSTSAGLAGTVV